MNGMWATRSNIVFQDFSPRVFTKALMCHGVQLIGAVLWNNIEGLHGIIHLRDLARVVLAVLACIGSTKDVNTDA